VASELAVSSSKTPEKRSLMPRVKRQRGLVEAKGEVRWKEGVVEAVSAA